MQQWLYYILILCFSCLSILLSAQCENSTHYPVGILDAPTNEGDTLIISTTQYAGDYSKVGGFIIGDSYKINSSSDTDYITIRTSDTNEVIAHGLTPITYTPQSSSTITIHINLSFPPCGEENINRITTISNQGVFVNIGRVGIRTINPNTALDVEGKLKIENDIHVHTDGSIRWNIESNDFEGYDGNKWRSFTSVSSEWGDHFAPKVSENKRVIKIDDNHIFFARSMAMDGETVIVNAINNDDGVNGRAHIYQNINDVNTEVFELYEASASPANVFASGGLDIDGSRAIVGTLPVSIEGEFTHGSITVFHLENGEWNMETVIEPDIFQFNFADKVSIDSIYIVASGGYGNSAIVYKMENGIWSLLQEVENHLGVSDNDFGREIQVYNNRLFISAPSSIIHSNVDKGKVYIYELDDNDLFVLNDSIITPSNSEWTGFGSSFKANEDCLVIGSPYQNYNNSETGGLTAIYYKSETGWQEHSVLDSPLDELSYRFGRQVDIHGDQIVVSTQGSVNNFQSSHIAYVYNKIEDEWILSAKLKPSDHARLGSFGDHVAITENTIVVGDKSKTTGHFDYGAFYVFNKK